VAGSEAATNLLPSGGPWHGHCYFRRSLHSSFAGGHFAFSAMALQVVPRSARWSFVMQRVRSLLRATPGRISRRIAQFVAIAAASLPAAGA
jgi:hypothetical protein